MIAFDGDDLLWTSADFDFLAESGYTILILLPVTLVLKATGSYLREIVIICLAITQDSLVVGMQRMDFHRGTFRYELAPSLGKIEAKGGDPAATFRRDGEILTSGSRGSNNNAFAPGILQVGGYSNNREMSTCEVAEIIIYDRELNDMELLQLEGSFAISGS